MNPTPPHIRVDRVDWLRLLPVLRLSGSFSMAIEPTRLLMALLLVVICYMGGRAFDSVVWGARVYPGEIQQYARLPHDRFDAWLLAEQARQDEALANLLAPVASEAQLDQVLDSPNPTRAATRLIDKHFAGRRDEITASWQELSVEPTDEARRVVAELSHQQRALTGRVQALRPAGIFESALLFKLDAFDRLIRATARLDLGLDQLRAARHPAERATVVGALRDLAVTLPGWLYQHHPWFLVFYVGGSLLAWSLLGGAIARSAAMQATRGERIGAGRAIRFAFKRWGWFLLTPLLPLLLCGAIALLLATGGLLFNLAVLDILAGLLFGLALVGGLIIALVLIGLAASHGLLFPALAIEGSDAMDAIARSYNYFYGQAWRWLAYSIVALIYGAITYLFVGLVIFGSLLATQYCVNLAVFADATAGASRFEAMLPAPQVGKLAYQVDWHALSLPGKVAAALVGVWVYLLIGLLAAYAVSFYVCVHTWVYLLLRQAADGTALGDVYTEPEATTGGSGESGGSGGSGGAGA